MSANEQIEKQIWESWLDDIHGKKLQKIREAASEIYDRNKKTEGDLPFYTPHGYDHCKAVEGLIHKLIPKNSHEKLSNKEKYYLLASAWVHDLGMLPLVSSTVYRSEPALDENEIRKRGNPIGGNPIVSGLHP